MSPLPFTDNAGLAWLFCSDCSTAYPADHEHDCRGSFWGRGFLLAVLASLVIWLVLVVAGLVSFGWRPLG